MDPVGIEKFQAMKRYRKRRERRLPLLLLRSLVRCLATALFLGLFLSCPLWLPHASSCLEPFFLFGSLPDVIRVIARPGCLFVLCNVIVIYLVGECKFGRNSPALDIQEEYQRRRWRSSDEWRENKKESVAVEDEALVEEDGEEQAVEEEEEEKEPSDEIDKKAADFIARINWQRRLEERRLLS